MTFDPGPRLRPHTLDEVIASPISIPSGSASSQRPSGGSVPRSKTRWQ
jgi:hypothetical protein